MADVFQRPLLATEHTEYDQGAERVALALAGRCGVPLAVVLPLLSNPEYEAVAPQLAARAEAQAGAGLAELTQAARAAGVVVAAQVSRGSDIAAEIVAAARRLGSDLIVARRRGQRGFLARLLVGEMVSRVVAHAHCSVLLVPRSGTLWSQRVLVALDPQAAPAGRLAVQETAVQLAAECGLPLTVVCVAQDAGARAQAGVVLAGALRAARARSLAAEGELRLGRPFEQILATADACGADLVVLGRHSGELPGRAWLGGTTQKVIGLAERPVLVAIDRTMEQQET